MKESRDHKHRSDDDLNPMYSWTWRRLDSSKRQGQGSGAPSDVFDFVLGITILACLIYFAFVF